MNAAFEGTMALAAVGDVVGATANHMDNTVALYGSVDPAVKGLALVAQAADAKLEAALDSGASSLRLLGWISVAVVAMAAAFTGWSAWSIYRREEDGAVADSMPGSMEEPARERAA